MPAIDGSSVGRADGVLYFSLCNTEIHRVHILGVDSYTEETPTLILFEVSNLKAIETCARNYGLARPESP